MFDLRKRINQSNTMYRRLSTDEDEDFNDFNEDNNKINESIPLIIRNKTKYIINYKQTFCKFYFSIIILFLFHFYSFFILFFIYFYEYFIIFPFKISFSKFFIVFFIHFFIYF